MARVFGILAFLGMVCASSLSVPTAALPKIIFGLYEAIPGGENNNAEFVKIFGFPDSLTPDQENQIGFHKEGAFYHKALRFAAPYRFIDLPFTLDEKQTTVFNGKNIEYEFTAEGNDSTAVFHAKFLETNGGAKFSIEAIFSSYGYKAIYAGDGLVAKRSYRRTLPGYVFGDYELDIAKSSGNLAEFYNEWFPLPKGINWSNNIRWWLRRRGDKFYEIFVANNVFYDQLVFGLGTVGRFSHENDTVTYKYEIVQISPETTTLIVTYHFPEKGLVVCTEVFDRQGVTTTAKSSTVEVTGRFKRVLPGCFMENSRMSRR